MTWLVQVAVVALVVKRGLEANSLVASSVAIREVMTTLHQGKLMRQMREVWRELLDQIRWGWTCDILSTIRVGFWTGLCR